MNQRGLTLIEVVIALGLLGVLIIAFSFGLISTSIAMSIADERTTAESLARSEMEYIKSAPYISGTWSYEIPNNPPSWDVGHSLPDGHDGYSIHATTETLYDGGIQKITLIIKHNGKPIITSGNCTLEGYKTNR